MASRRRPDGLRGGERGRLSALILLLGLLALAWLAGCNGGDPPKASRYDSIHALMQDQARRQQASPNQLFDAPALGYDPRYYPSEAAISFWSAWRLFGEAELLSAAQRQCDWAHSLMAADGLFTPPPFGMVSRLSQARLITGFMVAYQASGDARYLGWADAAVEGFLKLPVEPVSYQGRVFQLFNYAYGSTPPYPPQSTVRMNPNQESAIGLAFTQVYFAPQSRFFHSPQLYDLAWQNLNASLVLQDALGRIPTDQDHPEDFDTLYGGYTLMNLAWADSYWHSAELGAAVRSGAGWLSAYSDGSTDRYYPARYHGPLNDPVELWQRLPVLQAAGLLTPQFSASIDAVMARWNGFAAFPGGYLCPTAVLIDSLGVPAATVLGTAPPAKGGPAPARTTAEAGL